MEIKAYSRQTGPIYCPESLTLHLKIKTLR